MDTQTASLHDIACAVADGLAVDWDAATAAALTPHDRERIGWMRLLAGVATVHREEAQVLPRADAPFALTPVRDTATVENTPDYMPGTHWGGLQIIERIGRGTSGQVYRARDPRLDREVALKLLHDSGGATGYADPLAVVREARMLARVRHANVAAVYGANHADGCVGIWMELVEGRTLEEELRESGAISAADAIAIGRDLCRALDAVHRAGLLHRDVKAQNVMRDRRDGRIVLTDFSAGRERTDRPLAERALPGTVAGSPLYIAPEILGGTPASEQSDLYSLGVLLFRVVTGRFPVEGDSLAAM
jgi:eukaryotic-like serine/threonine-protein kinase